MSVCDLDLFDFAQWNIAARLLAREDRWQQPHVFTVAMASSRKNLRDLALQLAASEPAAARKFVEAVLAVHSIATAKTHEGRSRPDAVLDAVCIPRASQAKVKSI